MNIWGEKFTEMLAEKQHFSTDEYGKKETPHKATKIPQNESTPLTLKTSETEIPNLFRQQKILGTTIEVVLKEICMLNRQESLDKEMESSFQRLKSLELE